MLGSCSATLWSRSLLCGVSLCFALCWRRQALCWETVTQPCDQGPPSRCNLEGQPLLLGTLFLTLAIKPSITLCWLGGSLFAKQLRYISPGWLVGGGSCDISCPVDKSGRGRALPTLLVLLGEPLCRHRPAWCRMEWSGGHAVITGWKPNPFAWCVVFRSARLRGLEKVGCPCCSL